MAGNVAHNPPGPTLRDPITLDPMQFQLALGRLQDTAWAAFEYNVHVVPSQLNDHDDAVGGVHVLKLFVFHSQLIAPLFP